MLFPEADLRTIVYIDAFNLYYGCLRKTPYRWLDLSAFCRILLPKNDIRRIKYFTARVGVRPGDPDQPVRQQLYLRAIETIPNVEIHLGHYLSHEIYMPLANPPGTGSRFVKVVKTEEKGSDVNLATHLISDAYENAFEIAVLISNDSDLLGPVSLVKDRLNKKVGILNPQRHPAFVLRNAATFFKQIRKSALANAQFPNVMKDAHGTFHKPPSW